jgi:muramoyltetrapeptide carboxypeptidase
MLNMPPFLKRADKIGICCPAGYMPYENASECIRILQEQGYELIVGKTLGSDSQNYFSGTDEERLDELQAFMDAKEIKAILCGRGGYGTGRIIDRLDFRNFVKHPKWIIGFSDITVLHSHIYSNYKIAGLHAPMASAFKNGSNEFTDSLLAALRGEKGIYHSKAAENIFGQAKGKLVGGNLSLLAHLCGTASDIKTKDCILFLEDIGEYLYNTDRMLYQLKRSGKLENLAGLIIGGFSDSKDTERPFGKTITEMITELVKEYDYPVCFNFPVSHERENVALKIGVKYNLVVDENGGLLSEE